MPNQLKVTRFSAWGLRLVREGTGAPLKPEVGLSGKIVDLKSQPAVSQALMRLRDMFHDDLLIGPRNG